MIREEINTIWKLINVVKDGAYWWKVWSESKSGYVPFEDISIDLQSCKINPLVDAGLQREKDERIN